VSSSFEHHRRTLGALHLALGVSNLIPLLIVAGVLGGVVTITSDPYVTQVLGTIGGVVAVVLLICALPCVVAGYALLQDKPWGRGAALVSAILALPALPLGTAVAVYTFWVLSEDMAPVDHNGEISRCGPPASGSPPPATYP